MRALQRLRAYAPPGLKRTACERLYSQCGRGLDSLETLFFLPGRQPWCGRNRIHLCFARV